MVKKKIGPLLEIHSGIGIPFFLITLNVTYVHAFRLPVFDFMLTFLIISCNIL